RRVAAVAVHPDPEESLGLDLEARLLPELPAKAVKWRLAFVEKPARDVPQALERRPCPPGEQDAAAVDTERAGGWFRARVDDEAARGAGASPSVPCKLRTATRTVFPAVELAHAVGVHTA